MVNGYVLAQMSSCSVHTVDCRCSCCFPFKLSFSILMKILNCSFVDLDASTVVYHDDITDLHDFIDEFLLFPDVVDNGFVLLDES